jgi:hypothetical protein
MKNIILTIASGLMLTPYAQATEAYVTLGTDHQANDKQALYSGSATRAVQGVGFAYSLSDHLDLTSEWLHTGYGSYISAPGNDNLGEARFMLDTLSLNARLTKDLGSYARVFGSAGALAYTNGVHYTPDGSDLEAIGASSSRKYGAGGQIALGTGVHRTLGQQNLTLFADYEFGYALFTRPDHGAFGVLSLSGASNRLRMGVRF